MMKKITSIILVLVIILSMSITAFARASDQLDSYSVECSARGNGIFRVSATVNGTHPNMTKIGFPLIIIYESSNGTSNWTQVYKTSDVYRAGGSNSFQYDYSGTAGKYYYAFCSWYAEDSLGSDNRNGNSNTVLAK